MSDEVAGLVEHAAAAAAAPELVDDARAFALGERLRLERERHLRRTVVLSWVGCGLLLSGVCLLWWLDRQSFADGLADAELEQDLGGCRECRA